MIKVFIFILACFAVAFVLTSGLGLTGAPLLIVSAICGAILGHFILCK